MQIQADHSSVLKACVRECDQQRDRCLQYCTFGIPGRDETEDQEMFQACHMIRAFCKRECHRRKTH